MPSTNKTAKGLSQFLGHDRPDWLQDYNADMRAIDGAIVGLESSALRNTGGVMTGSLIIRSSGEDQPLVHFSDSRHPERYTQVGELSYEDIYAGAHLTAATGGNFAALRLRPNLGRESMLQFVHYDGTTEHEFPVWGAHNLPYETGSFTPILAGSAITGAPTYHHYNSGSYTRIGNLCLVNYEVWITNKGGIAGELAIGGLPFAEPGKVKAAPIACVSGLIPEMAGWSIFTEVYGTSLTVWVGNNQGAGRLTAEQITDNMVLLGQMFIHVS